MSVQPKQSALPKHLSVGQLADRADISVPTARYYESLGLISSERTSSNQRRFKRSTLRRVAFIAAAQRLGLTLAEIAETLALLPDGRDPTRADWTRLSRPWRVQLDVRIAELLRLARPARQLHRLRLPLAAPLSSLQP